MVGRSRLRNRYKSIFKLDISRKECNKYNAREGREGSNWIEESIVIVAGIELLSTKLGALKLRSGVPGRLQSGQRGT